ncbi:cupin domain-containing protein [Paraburkholderia kirstenboschensis]|uniref:Cupin domain-containing protein n=1 Tax=Paraburkholderia kirstenboschensis TaxID=1245436 RepID=A0ABZ0EEZ0_9BURK|nr:cupin domain-containing protein [Paraburkholderia kirstenboschensis]WOD15480.1 cupin domain-containing protein [Paraburkholderia kirstenboschensis]
MAFALTFSQLFSDAIGESHFGSVNLQLATRNFAPPAKPFDVSDFAAATRFGFLRAPSGWVGDLHPSPMCMWVFVLSGEVEFEASDGERRRVAAGGAILLEDTTGKGHQSRVIDDVPALLAVVQV